MTRVICSCPTPRTPRVSRVQHSGLASLSPQRPCTPGPGGSSTRSRHAVNRRSFGVGVAKIQSCLMEKASRKQAREECAHDDGGVKPGQTCRQRLKEHAHRSGTCTSAHQ
ncbi:hypothetical protein BGY98DRAFT_118043 [Russula aff. rugulosa BPL654]|nr:hypothetical protein BGY98DRAFT_118043 [Russula aff. rugulosa BPL654]